MTAFYTLKSIQKNSDQWKCSVELNPNHPVYKGHFPEKAIAPGVMLVQMVKNILEHEMGSTLKMTEARNIKFLNMVLPEEASDVELNIQFDPEVNYKINAEASIKEQTYFKLSATFV